MKLSIIIPAYNEEKLLPRCLDSVAEAVRQNAAADWCSEVIVVDNNSTDRTAELARGAGAVVVFEPINQISRARNAGARRASGDWFLFIDADSILHPRTLAELLRCIRQGRAAGGGCLIGLDETSLAVRLVVGLWNVISQTNRWAAGSFVFCRADACRDVGGFSTELYAAEELRFSQDVKRWAHGRGLSFAILKKQHHISSARKFHLYSPREWLQYGLRGLPRLGQALRDRASLDIFYDGRR